MYITCPSPECVAEGSANGCRSPSLTVCPKSSCQRQDLECCSPVGTPPSTAPYEVIRFAWKRGAQCYTQTILVCPGYAVHMIMCALRQGAL